MTIIRTIHNLDWSRKKPCADCPFLKSSPFHEGVAGSLPVYLESIDGNRFAHTCHKTDNRPACDGPQNYKGAKPQHCVGALLMLLKTGKGYDLQLPLLQAAEAGLIDLAEWTARAKQATDVFTLQGMLRFYLQEIEQRKLLEAHP